MNLQDVKIGFALTGSHCTMGEIFPQLKNLVAAGALVTPVVSFSVQQADTRFGEAKDVLARLEEITGHVVVKSIIEVEPFGPQKYFDLVVIAPCTGNTLAKLAQGITDTAVLMAAKGHLRNLKPVVLALATNDGLGLNAKNIGMLLATKNIFMVPFGQDDPVQKPNSLIAKLELLLPTIVKALKREQIQPILQTNHAYCNI